MIIKAKYVGKGLPGLYIQGQTYELQLRLSRFNQPFIYRLDGQMIPYQTFFSFLADWSEVTQIK